jgi:hypothetical protein
VSLVLRRVARGTFGDTSELSRDPELPRFMADLTRPWGIPVRPELLGRGQTYQEMASALLPSVLSGDDPVDLLVLAFGIHDVRPAQSAATSLSARCPGAPVAFAVCDQGTLAAFTALRLIDAYAPRRGLLLVLEQAALHYRPPAAGSVPDRHAGVALALSSSSDTGGRLVAVRQLAGLAPDDRPAALAAEVARVAADRPDAVLVPGPGLAGIPLPEGVPLSPGPAGQPHTTAWWGLAEPPAGLVLLADSDGGELAVAAFDFTGGSSP